jgi:hypothetical protein
MLLESTTSIIVMLLFMLSAVVLPSSMWPLLCMGMGRAGGV